MIGAAVELPDFTEFLAELDDPEVARDFLKHILGIGYEIVELKTGVDVRTLPDEYTVQLAKTYWSQVFLTEYPSYGEHLQ